MSSSSYNSYFQYVGFFIFLLVIAFFFYTILNKQVEGMTNNNSKTQQSDKTSHGSNAEKYSEKIKSSHNEMKDKINITNYRTDYENLVIEMNDYVDGMMLNELLTVDPNNADPSNIMKKLENINKMTNGKQNLNHIMKYLDAN